MKVSYIKGGTHDTRKQDPGANISTAKGMRMGRRGAFTVKNFDDEVRRVCETPGDPCGFTTQHSQGSGLHSPLI
jgi:hypothetical protein